VRWLAARRDRILVKTSSSEAAAALLEVLHTHGVSCRLTRRDGKVIRLDDPEKASTDARLDPMVKAVEMWLMLDETPNRVDVRYGRRKTTLTREAAGSTSPLAPDA
jgi:hypothetical protein